MEGEGLAVVDWAAGGWGEVARAVARREPR